MAYFSFSFFNNSSNGWRDGQSEEGHAVGVVIVCEQEAIRHGPGSILAKSVRRVCRERGHRVVEGGVNFVEPIMRRNSERAALGTTR